MSDSAYYEIDEEVRPRHCRVKWRLVFAKSAVRGYGRSSLEQGAVMKLSPDDLPPPNVAGGRPPTGYVVSGEASLAYYEIGTGRPLLLINGGPGFPSQHFQPVADRIASDMGFRVICFDPRGTGRSTLERRSPELLTLRHLVDDVETLRSQLNSAPWIVMGHSFGALNAMAYATYYPDAVSALILSAPIGTDVCQRIRLISNIKARLTDEEWSQYLALGESGVPRTYEEHLTGLALLLPAYIHDRKHLPALRAAVVDSRIFVPDVQTMILENLQAESLDLTPSLRALETPTLIIQGDDDPLGLDTAEEIHQIMHNSKLIVVPDAGHFSWIDNPVDYYSTLAGYLNRS